MENQIELTGMVISAMPVGDYNKRLVVLTGEAGKITVFARGAKKPGSKFMGSTEPFCFGKFKLFRGKDAYTLIDVNITRHFEELKRDYNSTIIASYFLEIADFYTRENMEAYEELNLLYASFLALISDKFDPRLVKAVYEAKSLVIAGEYPGLSQKRAYSGSIVNVYDYIRDTEMKRLYSFSVTPEIVDQMAAISDELIRKITGHKFKSLEFMLM